MLRLRQNPTDFAAPPLRQTEILSFPAPLPPPWAERVETFLLQIFKYGHYSFRSLLRGEYADTLSAMFYLAVSRRRLLAVAAALHPCRPHAAALLGPLAVSPDQRRRGLASLLLKKVLHYLYRQNCQTVLVGVKNNPAAWHLYRQAGFHLHHGIILRYDLRPDTSLEQNYFRPTPDVAIRPAHWGDFCGAQALYAAPCSMMAFDLTRGLFSAAYVAPDTFIPVFPGLMHECQSNGGLAQVLAAGPAENIVGLAQLRRCLGRPARHTAILDFFVHDNFLDHAPPLLQSLLDQCRSRPLKKVHCSVPASDSLKRSVIESCGGRIVACHTHHLMLRREFHDMCMYEWSWD